MAAAVARDTDWVAIGFHTDRRDAACSGTGRCLVVNYDHEHDCTSVEVQACSNTDDSKAEEIGNFDLCSPCLV